MKKRNFSFAACCTLLGALAFAGAARSEEPAASTPGAAVADAAPAVWVEPTLDMTTERQRVAMKEDLVRRLTPGKNSRGTLVTATDTALGVRFLPESSGSRGASSGTIFFPFKMGKGQHLADPQFLPGGAEAIVKIKFASTPGAAESFHLYHINFAAMKIQKLTSEMLVHDSVSISPDGKFVAFLRGVNGEGQTLPGETARLCVLDRQSGREQIVAKGDALASGGWEWTLQNTLIVTMLKTLPAATDSRPHLYEVAMAGGEPKLLVRDGWRPSLSPDGTRIAFFGAEDAASPGALAANWTTSPRGVYLCVAKRDGSERRALVRQMGAYPVLQWEGDNRTLLTIKAKQWVPDLGDRKISNFQPLRADEYKGGLTGVLDTDSGDWSVALLLDDGVSERDFYNRSPNPNVDYVFMPVGPSGDNNVSYVRGIKTQKTEKGVTAKDILWAISAERRNVNTIAELEGASRGFDWLDASSPDAPRPQLPLSLDTARPLNGAIPQLKKLLETLPPTAAMQQEVMSELARRVEQEIAPLEMPPVEGLPAFWWEWQKSLSAIDRKDDKAYFVAAHKSLSLAQRLLAGDSDAMRAHGMNYAVESYRIIFDRDPALGAQILVAFAMPIIEATQITKLPLNGYFLDSLGDYARLSKAPENFGLDVLKIILAQSDPNDPFDWRDDYTRLRLADQLARRERYAEAIQYLKQVEEEPRLSQAKGLIAKYEKILAKAKVNQ